MKTACLVVTGSVAAVKVLPLLSALQKSGLAVRCVLTQSARHFVSANDIEALTGLPAHHDLFSADEMSAMWHIRHSREADLIVVAPATANFMAKAAQGIADDMASTLVLASNKPVLFVPAMNSFMWDHPATQRHVEQLIADGADILMPETGALACGEHGIGRMAEPDTIVAAVMERLNDERVLAGKTILVTSGPTYEDIDPVRFIGNRSSGKQGRALAEEFVRQGADVTYITGPTALPDPSGARTRHVRTACEMLAACKEALPVDAAICAAAVADWRVDQVSQQKLKKAKGQETLQLNLVKNPDILHFLSTAPQRPALVIGFAAETENLLANARQKLRAKKCDLILANNVQAGEGFAQDCNRICCISSSGDEEWPLMTKRAIAKRLAMLVYEMLMQKKAA